MRRPRLAPASRKLARSPRGTTRMIRSQTSRRSLLLALASTTIVAAVGATLLVARGAAAEGPLKVGVLIPGSKSDKGWMESGYDGLKRAEKKHGAKVKVTFVENVKFADMEQALTMVATKRDLVIGVGGQSQA